MTDDAQFNEIVRELRQFVAERDWAAFHDPKNLAMALASEAGELLSELRWVSSASAETYVRDPDNRHRIEHEVADIAIFLIYFCDRTGIDLFDAIREKIRINAGNYPARESRNLAERPGIIRKQSQTDG